MFTITVGHGAANVTLGIPRLREIVMTASQKPKTPSMSMTVQPSVPVSDVDAFCKKASRLPLSHVVDTITVTERLSTNGEARSKDFTIDLKFYPKAAYQAEYDVEPSEILATFATKFPLILKKELQNEVKKLNADLKNQMADLGKSKKVKERPTGGAEDPEDEDEERAARQKDDDEASEVGDGDASAMKRQRQSKEQATYEDDDEEEDDGMGEFDDAAIEAAYLSDDIDGSSEDDVAKSTSRQDARLEAQIEQVEQAFLENFTSSNSFSFSDSGCSIGLQVRLIRYDLNMRSSCLHRTSVSIKCTQVTLSGHCREGLYQDCYS